MNKVYSTFILLLIGCASFSQSGTIKIAKPAEPKSTVQDPIKTVFVFAAGTNYTFRETGKFGYEAEFYSGFYRNHFMIGLKYTHENEFYTISPFNKQTGMADIGYSRSETESDNLKVPLGFSTILTNGQFIMGSRNGGLIISRLKLSMAVVPEYLLNSKNQYGRLTIGDFNRFNFSGYIALGFRFYDYPLALNLSYSTDFLNNLKDPKLYNEQGLVVAKQTTKTRLAALTLIYRIQS